jgi:hypothetical protein
VKPCGVGWRDLWVFRRLERLPVRGHLTHEPVKAQNSDACSTGEGRADELVVLSVVCNPEGFWKIASARIPNEHGDREGVDCAWTFGSGCRVR